MLAALCFLKYVSSAWIEVWLPMLLYGLLWLQKSMNFIKTGLPPDFSLGNLTNQDQSNFCLPVSMRLRAHDGTAIGMKHLPGHVAGIVRGQEDITGRHLSARERVRATIAPLVVL